MTIDPLDRIAAIIQDGIDADTGDYTSQDEAEAALQILVEIARAARATAHEYTLCAEDANDGSFAIWSEDRLIAALVAQRAALARLDNNT